jgi:hypothetical protein
MQPRRELSVTAEESEARPGREERVLDSVLGVGDDLTLASVVATWKDGLKSGTDTAVTCLVMNP